MANLILLFMALTLGGCSTTGYLVTTNPGAWMMVSRKGYHETLMYCSSQDNMQPKCVEPSIWLNK